MTMVQLIQSAKIHLAETVGLKPENVIRAIKDDGFWRIEVEMLELKRIPYATDLLGVYEALLDENGDLLSFERKRSRLRGDTEEEKL